MISACWLFPEPTLNWAAGAGVADAQKKIVPAMRLLLTSTRLFPQPASAPSVQEARAGSLESVWIWSISDPEPTTLR